MDKLDIEIGKEMSRGNVRNLYLLRSDGLRTSFRSVARTLGVDQGTIRRRIRKMEEKGVIRGWFLQVNPRVLGRELQCLMFDVSSGADKREVIRKISAMTGVITICNYQGPYLHVLVSSGNIESLAKIGREMAEIAGGVQPIWARRPTAKLGAPLTPTDAQIIKSLQQDPWKPYESVAREVRISSKTARKRITELAETGAIQVSVDVNPTAFEGFVPAALLVFYAAASSRDQVVRRIIKHLGNELFFAELGDPECGYFALSLPNAARLEQLGNWVQDQGGVRTCRTLILLDMIQLNIPKAEEIERIAPLQ